MEKTIVATGKDAKLGVPVGSIDENGNPILYSWVIDATAALEGSTAVG